MFPDDGQLGSCPGLAAEGEARLPSGEVLVCARQGADGAEKRSLLPHESLVARQKRRLPEKSARAGNFGNHEKAAGLRDYMKLYARTQLIAGVTSEFRPTTNCVGLRTPAGSPVMGHRWPYLLQKGAGFGTCLIRRAVRHRGPALAARCLSSTIWPMNHLRSKTVLGERREMMKKVLSAAAAVITIVMAVPWATSLAERSKKEIVGLTAGEVRWFTPPYYNDGRQRAHLFGDSSQGGPWIDRVKIPSGARVLAHTHPEDELVTVIEGTWYLGEGAKFDSAKLKGYPAGSFIVIPAGIPHFVAAKEGTVVVQLSGIGKFQTNYLEK
jgi:quercetin dioxygenase-like cupin family protein